MASETPGRTTERVRIGATIRALREAYGLTRIELARGIGVSEALVSRIESGDRTATPGTCRAIAELLGVPLAAIIVERYEEIREPAKAAS